MKTFQGKNRKFSDGMCAYSKDDGCRVNPLKGHQWTPNDCKD